MNSILSIIIPCFNSEATLEATLYSVLNQNYNDWEAIIVNDGSPDNLETIALNWTKKDERFKYYKKNNGGLGSARNFGIEKATGSYILPLDSDNKVRPEFAKEAVAIMDAQKEVGVVYGNSMYFGEKDGLWNVGAFDEYKILRSNYIDACAVVRKSLFDSIGGYEEDLPHQGHEDWDFWLSVMKTEYRFHYLKEVTFDYRVSNNSMIKSFDKEMLEKNINFIKRKHYELYLKAYPNLFNENTRLKKQLSVSIEKVIINKMKRIFK
ncbi:glycosyltransferase family 2 protein [Bizionia arctica]|uniref:Glycosyl transferase n=1 Tax=Bizionia arctica TaxID=1495645 RepID=A0A917GQ69_9FLAO|nr:glycosyltransferase family A protein [Bizionia arctica]GGG53152.1 glycosyl transferase [Bizionia arctica]